MSRIVKNLAVLISGNAIAQGITVLLSPILSRLYSPEDFGTFMLLTSLFYILTSIVTWRYEVAIMIPETEEEAKELTLFALCIVGVGTMLLCILAPIFLLIVPTVPLWMIYVLVICVGLYGCNQIVQGFNTRKKQFAWQSQSNVIRTLSMSVSQISLSFSSFKSLGLILGQLIGQTLATGYTFLRTFGQLAEWNIAKIPFKHLLHKYREFPLLSTPQIAMNTISQNLPAFLLFSLHANSVATGLYALALRVLQTPVSLVTSSMRQIFLQQAGELSHSGKSAYTLMRKTTLILFFIGIVPVCLFILFAAPFFEWVFGAEWYEAGHYAGWISLWLFGSFLNPPAIACTQIYHLQGFMLKYEIILLCSRLTALCLGSTPLSSIALYSVVGLFFNVFLIVKVGLTLKKRSEVKNEYSESEI